MAGSKQSHGSLINDLCPLMVDPVVPQRLLFLLFAEAPIEDLVSRPSSQHFSGSLMAHTAIPFKPDGTNCNTFITHFLILLFAERPTEVLVIKINLLICFLKNSRKEGHHVNGLEAPQK